MKKEDVIFERKEFLNLPGHNGMANVVASIVRTSWQESKTNDEGKPLHHNVEYKLDFADCDRRISMEVDDYDQYSRDNALHKVDTLIDVLTDFRETLVKELKYQKRLERRRKRHEAEEKKGEE
jgi:hypothetical protein